MKIRYYIDIWPGMDLTKYIPHATPSPCEKSPTSRRIAFDVTIPDQWITDYDHVAPEVSVPTVVADREPQA